MISVIEAIQAVANLRRVNFLPAITVVDVDGREYPNHSLARYCGLRRNDISSSLSTILRPDEKP